MLEIHAQSDYDRPALEILLDDIVQGVASLREPTAAFNRVLLKPNFVVPVRLPDASVTHPDFYMSLATVLIKRGFVVGIGESPAIGSCSRALQYHSVLDECRDRGIEVVEFSGGREFEGVTGDRNYGLLSIAQELSRWHGVVNVPKLKTHQQFTFTGATKNLYGCVSGKRKFVRHNLCANDPKRFARMIIANAIEVDCVAHIADGITAMHVKGPRGGQPYPLGCVLASDNPLALDRVFCELTGLDPRSTPLFSALDAGALTALDAQCATVLASSPLHPVDDFEHAPLIHISFSPWHVARSGWRTLRYTLQSVRNQA